MTNQTKQTEENPLNLAYVQCIEIKLLTEVGVAACNSMLTDSISIDALEVMFEKINAQASQLEAAIDSARCKH